MPERRERWVCVIRSDMIGVRRGSIAIGPRISRGVRGGSRGYGACYDGVGWEG